MRCACCARLPTTQWIPATQWIPTTQWIPATQWLPTAQWIQPWAGMTRQFVISAKRRGAGSLIRVGVDTGAGMHPLRRSHCGH